MEFLRTANAGVLLKMDGVSILLDGVSGELHPYFGTPDDIRKKLTEQLPDMLAFTHTHRDHYDEDYAIHHQKTTQKSYYGPECVNPVLVGGVKIQAISTRHIGKNDVPHVSFIINGSKTVWFMGDAAPAALKEMKEMPKPNVIFVPFAYGLTPSAWRDTKETGAKSIVFLHLPDSECDELGIWDTLIKNTADTHVLIPDIGHTIII